MCLSEQGATVAANSFAVSAYVRIADSVVADVPSPAPGSVPCSPYTKLIKLALSMTCVELGGVTAIALNSWHGECSARSPLGDRLTFRRTGSVVASAVGSGLVALDERALMANCVWA